MSDCLAAEPLPEIRQPHWVQGNHYMCLAVLDKNGKWRSFSNNRELMDVVAVHAD
jgi:hypothetical protein